MYKKKMEFSKVIMVVAMLINVYVIGFTSVMVWRTNDVTPLYYLIPAVATEVAAGSGFYYTKAGKENLVKLMKDYPWLRPLLGSLVGKDTLNLEVREND